MHYFLQIIQVEMINIDHMYCEYASYISYIYACYIDILIYIYICIIFIVYSIYLYLPEIYSL